MWHLKKLSKGFIQWNHTLCFYLNETLLWGKCSQCLAARSRSGADLGFPVGGADIRCGRFSAKTYWKMKELGPVDRGSSASRFHPTFIFHKVLMNVLQSPFHIYPYFLNSFWIVQCNNVKNIVSVPSFTRCTSGTMVSETNVKYNTLTNSTK